FTSRRASISRWNCISSSICRSSRPRRASALNAVLSAWYQATSLCPLCGESKHPIHGAGRVVPLGHLGFELTPAVARDLVVACAPVVLAVSVVGADPPAPQHPLERRVKRALVDVEDVARDLSESDGDAPAVHRLEREGPGGEHIQGP